jgi:hypothetical protein
VSSSMSTNACSIRALKAVCSIIVVVVLNVLAVVQLSVARGERVERRGPVRTAEGEGGEWGGGGCMVQFG